MTFNWKKWLKITFTVILPLIIFLDALYANWGYIKNPLDNRYEIFGTMDAMNWFIFVMCFYVLYNMYRFDVHVIEKVIWRVGIALYFAIFGKIAVIQVVDYLF